MKFKVGDLVIINGDYLSHNGLIGIIETISEEYHITYSVRINNTFLLPYFERELILVEGDEELVYGV